MASPSPHPQRQKYPAVETETSTVALERGLVQAWRERRAERKPARSLTPRSRRAPLLGLLTGFGLF